MSNSDLIPKLLNVENRFTKSFTSFTGTTQDFKNLSERYLASVQLCQRAHVALKLTEARNEELLVENKRLKEMLFSAMEKNLLGDITNEI